MSLDPVVDPRALVSAEARTQIVLVDARSGERAYERYKERHLEGALYVSLDHDLAMHDHDPAEGGRHPLPDVAAFSRVLGFLGIGPQSHVVVYDDKSGANAAARFWWMLRAAGIARSQVLDGGLESGVAAGIPTGSRGPRPTVRSPKPFAEWSRPRADAEEVAAAARDPRRLVIDVRDPSRYAGQSDPFDPRPGHIPGAVNVPYATNLRPDGRLLPAADLEAKYRAVLGDRAPSDVIVSCGSGVTACHTLLAMERAGLSGAKLYVGSYSEWSRSDRPIASGEEPGGEGTTG
jgi:thiosulfate/3-mercaptopyruvate sulfurtransferase